MQDRRALPLKAHQSESHLPIGRSLGMFQVEADSVILVSFRLLPPTPSGHLLWEQHKASCLQAGGKGFVEIYPDASH